MEVLREGQQEVGNSGIYRISCVANDHFYYGSSINLKARIKNHLSKLRSGRHRNKRLQRVFEKYGEASLTFKVVKYCDPGFVLDVEQDYLDEHASSDNCMNFCKSAKAPMAGVKFSSEHKRRISEAQSRNKYTFHYGSGEVESFDSLRQAGARFGVKPAIVSKWFKRKDLGRKHGIMRLLGVVRAEKSGDESIILLPREKKEAWMTAGASSRTEYYRMKRKSMK
jgi:group I intron endonuclease